MISIMTRSLAAAALVVLAACASGDPRPADVQAGTACSQCRMTVIDGKLASQLVAPGEEPRVFDDLGCLAAYLGAHPLPDGATIVVADHSTGAWVAAGDAVYSRDPAIATPMNSHLVAHRDDASRASDAGVHPVARLRATDVFGPAAAHWSRHDR